MKVIIHQLDTKTTEAELRNSISELGATLVDASLLPQAALLEIEPDSLEDLRETLGADWKIQAQKTYRVPDTRKKVLQRRTD